jgi:hypothetical protein
LQVEFGCLVCTALDLYLARVHIACGRAHVVRALGEVLLGPTRFVTRSRMLGGPLTVRKECLQVGRSRRRQDRLAFQTPAPLQRLCLAPRLRFACADVELTQVTELQAQALARIEAQLAFCGALVHRLAVELRLHVERLRESQDKAHAAAQLGIRDVKTLTQLPQLLDHRFTRESRGQQRLLHARGFLTPVCRRCLERRCVVELVSNLLESTSRCAQLLTTLQRVQV